MQQSGFMKKDFLAELTAGVVSAYVGKHVVPVNELPALISDVYAALGNASSPVAQPEPVPVEKPKPAVPVRKSVQHDFIVCLEDGRKFKSLKRHLSAKYGLTPEKYREKWDLPADYPMVAPSYAEARSQLAKKSGLGRRASQGRPAKTRK